MPVKYLTPQQKHDLKKDLALRTASQRELALKYGVTEGRISQFKSECEQEIESIAEKALEQVTGELIKNQNWRLKEYERDLAKLEGYRSPDAVRARTQILRQVAEEMGQLPPRMAVAIQVAEHHYHGVDIDQV